MKKLKCTLIIGIIAILMLCGCGNSKSTAQQEPTKPDNVSQRVYELGCNVIKTTDAFLTGDISIDDTSSKIDDLCTQIGLSEDDSYSQDAVIKVYALGISINLISIKGTISMNDLCDMLGESRASANENINNLYEYRDNIAKQLGIATK